MSAHEDLLPESTVQPREREVWTNDDRRVMARFIKLLNERGLAVELRCMHPRCLAQPAVTREPDANGFDLVCGHKRRVFRRGV